MRSNHQNPLLSLSFEIPFGTIKAEHIEPGIKMLIEEAVKRIDHLVHSDGNRTYDNTLGALENATEDLELAASVAAHLEAVATYPEYREAHEAIQPILSRFWTQLTLNEKLWDALQDFATTEEARQLDAVHARHLKQTLDEFRRHGAELDLDGKKRIEQINTELAEITTKFSQNILDATNAFELILEDSDQLAGLPQSAISAAAENARGKGLEGWRFTLQAPSVIPILTYLDDESIRKTVWSAYNNRATESPTDNRGIIKRILVLRHEKARLLGYDDFSDLVLENRMAKRGDSASQFVTDLKERTGDQFAAENLELQKFKEAHTEDEAPGLQPWDVGYYSEKQRAALYNFDDEELRPYFPVDSVLAGAFETVSRLYGVSVERINMPTWDPAVLTYRLLDEEGIHIASFYVDLYPRENKRGGAWMNDFITGRDGEPHLGLICANFTPPLGDGDKPALLTHREVETLFHEFGHLMHHCLTKVPIRSMAGTSVAWDFVELPSQIMENWCWERESLDTFARHVDTGEVIPDDLFAKMVRARTYRAANGQMRQLAFATLDLSLHRELELDTDPDVMEYARDILQEYSATKLPEKYGFVASFGHLFSSSVGYAAGYYSYKWAEVLDADAFTRFRQAGVYDRDTGDAFRRTILEKGDSKDPMALYIDFMGREPEQTALLERLGLQ